MEEDIILLGDNFILLREFHLLGSKFTSLRRVSELFSQKMNWTVNQISKGKAMESSALTELGSAQLSLF